MRGVGDYRRLATTIDDAAGEAFDKAAKLLGLPYPGGPAIEALAADGDPTAVPLPRPLVGSARAAFLLRRPQERGPARGRRRARTSPPTSPPASSRRWSIAWSTAPRRALERSDAPTLVVAGGVAANRAMRAALADLAAAQRPRLLGPAGAGCAPTMRR